MVADSLSAVARFVGGVLLRFTRHHQRPVIAELAAVDDRNHVPRAGEFLGGTTAWGSAANLTRQARARGVTVHMATSTPSDASATVRNLGCQSVDGRFLTYAGINLRRLRGWIHVERPAPLPWQRGVHRG
jgi:hypothetical protein